MNFKFALLSAVLAGTFAAAAHAGDSGTVYGAVSTNGLGIGYARSISDNWALRGQYNTYSRSFSGNIGDTGATGQLDVGLKLDALQLLADWYPSSGGGFRLTGGAVANNNKITMSGVGNVNGTNTQLDGTIKMSGSGITPYLGIGYSTRPKDAKGWGFTFDLGVMFQDPSVDLNAPGASAADVAAQKAKIQNDLSALKNMPLLSMGVGYSF